jgi:hypothetical protein
MTATLTPDQRSAFKMAFSPNIDRAGMRGRDAIVLQMADDMAVFAANAGSVSEDDLGVIGWTPAQIAQHGREARTRAYSRAAR